MNSNYIKSIVIMADAMVPTVKSSASSLDPAPLVNPTQSTPSASSIQSTLAPNPIQSKRLEQILRAIVDGDPTTPDRTIYFSPNGWGGFCNSFRAVRSLALYSLLYGFKLRSMTWLGFSVDSRMGSLL